MSKFTDLTFEQLKSDRSELVVDSLHGYARIAQRVRVLWDAICLLGIEGRDLLSILVGISSMTQHVAESLGLVSLQEDHEVEVSQSQKELYETKEALRTLLNEMAMNSQPIPGYQMSKPRYKFEFTQEYYLSLVERSRDGN